MAWPFLNSIRVGMARIPNLVGVAGFSSTFILTMRTLPSYSAASSSMMGPTARQGPHQGAQKSSSTGISEFRTTLSKVASEICSAIVSLLGKYSKFPSQTDGSRRCRRAATAVKRLVASTATVKTVTQKHRQISRVPGKSYRPGSPCHAGWSPCAAHAASLPWR